MTHDPQNRAEALDAIVALATRYGLNADDIAARLIRTGETTPQGQRGILMRMLTYIGGLLIFAGLGIFIAMQWDGMGSAARVLITLGPGIAALILAIATLRDPRYAGASTPLFLIAALLEPTGLFVMLHEYGTGDDIVGASMLVNGTMCAQMLLLFAVLRRANLLFWGVTFAFSFLWGLMDKLGIDDNTAATVLGLSGLIVTGAVNRTPWRSFTPFTYFVFALCFAIGVFELVDDLPGGLDFSLIAIAGLMVFASVKAQSRSFLCASVFAMLGYLGYLTDQYFVDQVGWPLVLIFMGFVMIGLSAYALRLGNAIKNAQSS